MKTEPPHNQKHKIPDLDAPTNFLREVEGHTATLAAMLLAAQRLSERGKA
jgi:hypothetical protein